MKSTDSAKRSKNYWSAILGDMHFWIPAGMLLGGLLLLRWIR